MRIAWIPAVLFCMAVFLPLRLSESHQNVAWLMVTLIMSSHNSNELYTGRQRVYKNADEWWYSISDTLNASYEYYPANRHVITVVAESPINGDVLYAGTSDGKVWVTENGGDFWTDITTGLPDRYVTDLEASTIEEGRVYVTHSGYKDGDDMPHIHVSDDYGQTWVGIDGDLPDFGLNHLEVHKNFGDSVLFVACDAGVYYTTNSGDNWNRVGDNMPIILVFDIEIDYDANRLVAGTFARSIQSLSLDSLFGVVTSIKEYEKVTFSLYPNPASQQIKITSNENIKGSKWEISDVNGKFLKQGLINGESISIAQFPSGVYFMSLEGANGREVKKWIKQ